MKYRFEATITFSTQCSVEKDPVEEVMPKLVNFTLESLSKLLAFEFSFNCGRDRNKEDPQMSMCEGCYVFEFTVWRKTRTAQTAFALGTILSGFVEMLQQGSDMQLRIDDISPVDSDE